MKPISQWAESDLQFLIDNKLSEANGREYKESISLSSDKERKELCKDVSSFANGQGGVIVFGLKANKEPEKGSVPVSLTPIYDMNLKEVANQILLDGVKPRMEFRFYSPPSSDGKGEYVIIEIPKSLHGLHMVTLKGENRYYIRRDFQSLPMTPFEIEEAYKAYALMERETETKIERYRLENPNANLTQPLNAWMSVTALPIFPVTDLFTPLCSKQPAEIPLMRHGVCAHDGLIGSDQFFPHFYGLSAVGKPPNNARYSFRHLIFREGALNFGCSLNATQVDKMVVLAKSVARDFHNMLALATGLFADAGYMGAVKLLFEIDRISGFRLDYGSSLSKLSNESSTLRFSHLDTSSIMDLASTAPKVLQPMQDHLWQTFGLRRCDLYKEGADGVYIDGFLKESGLFSIEE
ncbi:MAG: ATP-binding protein [Bacteroidetes bacterium]|nr:ATP-binding protein [Bacteroidota bacterium]